jgi:alkylation response protein AidB-like acyl-CoA dehydrogenase
MARIEASTLLDEVARLRPIIEEHSPAGESDRQVPAASYEAMREAGLFRIWAPAAFGGLELHPVEGCRVFEAVSRIDSSTGWLLAISSAFMCTAAWLPEAGMEQVFAPRPDPIIAGGFFPPGTAVPVGGGYRLTARVSFASGCHQAQWFVVPSLIMDGDEPKIDPASGQPIAVAPFIPRADVDVIDTWNTVGMRGTFSADVAVNDVFVPDDRVGLIRPTLDLAGPMDTPLFRLTPWPGVHSETAVSLGIATSGIDRLVRLATEKTPSFAQTLLRDRQLAQHHVAKARALVDSSRLYLHNSMAKAFEAVSERRVPLDPGLKQSMQLSACLAAEQCATAVDLVHQAAGTTAIRIGAGFERHFRDAHVLTQHASKNVQRYEDVGKMIYGLTQDWFVLNL